MKQLFVIKIGGNIVDDSSQLHSFLEQLASIALPVILVHGGGKVATQIGDQLGITSQYHNGRRITDDATIDLVTMVYGGLVNKKIVAQLQSLGSNAIGLTGADGNLIPANKRPVKEIDFGWVGDVLFDQINTAWLEQLLHNGMLPVVAPLTHDGKGHLLNTNADTIASALAVAMGKHFHVRLLYCFEKKGVLNDVADDHSVVPLITRKIHLQMLQEGRLADGILPKIDNAFAAIAAGVHEVLIGHAADLIPNTGANTTGTLIREQ